MTEAATELPRRQLSGRKPEMVARLLDATGAVIAATGYDALTVRQVAKAAGVSGATAYNYFAGKEHLLAEVYWRRLVALPPLDLPASASLAERVDAAVAPIAHALDGEPELAAGVTTALLAHDPDVKLLRERIGSLFADRIGAALGDQVPAEAQPAFTMMLLGALISAGMEAFEYGAIPGLMTAFAATFEAAR
jgi:AcrR family transcriptional regulator